MAYGLVSNIDLKLLIVQVLCYVKYKTEAKTKLAYNKQFQSRFLKIKQSRKKNHLSFHHRHNTLSDRQQYELYSIKFHWVTDTCKTKSARYIHRAYISLHSPTIILISTKRTSQKNTYWFLVRKLCVSQERLYLALSRI